MDSDCESAVCDDTMGVCTSEAQVLYASPTGPDAGTCLQAMPCSISQAVALVDGTKTTVKLASGTYTAAVVLKGPSMTLHGFGATINASSATPLFDVSGDSKLNIVGVSLNNAAQAVLGCRDTNSVNVDRAAITGFNAVTGCALTMTRSTVHGTNSAQVLMILSGATSIQRTLIDGGGGVTTATATDTAHFTNSVFANLGNSTNGGFGGNLTISYSTIVNTRVVCPGAVDPICIGGTATNPCINNSVVLNTLAGAPTDTITGSCAVTYSAVFPQATALGSGTNDKIGSDPMLKDPANGDNHLTVASPAVDAADFQATNPIDFDGTSRPQGNRNDMGAFEFKP